MTFVPESRDFYVKTPAEPFIHGYPSASCGILYFEYLLVVHQSHRCVSFVPDQKNRFFS